MVYLHGTALDSFPREYQVTVHAMYVRTYHCKKMNGNFDLFFFVISVSCLFLAPLSIYGGVPLTILYTFQTINNLMTIFWNISECIGGCIKFSHTN